MAGPARDLAAIQQGPHVRDRFGQPVESLPEAGPEVQPERAVLALEPCPADPHDRATAADVVDRRHAFHRQTRIAEGVRPDEEAESNALGRLGDGGEGRVALEDRLLGVAEDRLEMVPGPDVVIAESLGRPGSAEEPGPVAGLAPQGDPKLEVRHARRLRKLDEIECMHSIAGMVVWHTPRVVERRSRTDSPRTGSIWRRTG